MDKMPRQMAPDDTIPHMFLHISISYSFSYSPSDIRVLIKFHYIIHIIHHHYSYNVLIAHTNVLYKCFLYLKTTFIPVSQQPLIALTKTMYITIYNLEDML